jgi:hypothetical protein
MNASDDDDPEIDQHFSRTCAWCACEVVSFVAPPHMVRVSATVESDPPGHTWHVCLPCYADLIKLIAAETERQRELNSRASS